MRPLKVNSVKMSNLIFIILFYPIFLNVNFFTQNRPFETELNWNIDDVIASLTMKIGAVLWIDHTAQLVYSNRQDISLTLLNWNTENGQRPPKH